MIYLFRGLPGAGKSTAARDLQEKTGYIMLEPDMLLIKNGKYVFNHIEYADAVKNLRYCVEQCARRGIDVIYSDVLCNDELEILINEFSSLNFEFIVFDFEISATLSRYKNIHDVNDDDIISMSKKWSVYKNAVNYFDWRNQVFYDTKKCFKSTINEISRESARLAEIIGYKNRELHILCNYANIVNSFI